MLTQEQFTQIVQTYINTVFRVALHYTKNPTDAEDIVQNTFLKLYQQKKAFESEAHTRAWLIRVAVNEGKSSCAPHGAAMCPTRNTPPP